MASFQNPHFLRNEPVEVVAARIRSEAGIGDTVPVDLVEICRSLDYPIFYLDLPNSKGYAALDENGCKVICVKKGMGIGETRFTIAHEIGHLELLSHKDEELKAESRNPSNPYRRLTDRKFESEADAFASALLFPNLTFKRDIAAVGQNIKISEIESLVDRYQSSFAATAKRFVSLHGEVLAFVHIKREPGDVARVHYSVNSEAFREERFYLDRSLSIPANSRVYQALDDGQNRSATTNAGTWLSHRRPQSQRVEEMIRPWKSGQGCYVILWVRTLVED